MKRDSFVFYTEWREQLMIYSPKQQGDILMALLNYINDGTEPELPQATYAAFSFMRAQLDRDTEKWKQTVENRRKAGAKGGRPKKKSAQISETEPEENEEYEEAEEYEEYESEKAKKANGFLGDNKKAKKAVNEYVDEYVDVDDNVNEDDIKISSPKGDSCKRVDYQSVVDLFNSVCGSMPRVQSITNKRRKLIKSRLADIGGDMNKLREVFEKAQSSDFLVGKNSDWRCGFDWIMNAGNFVKVMEGNYDNSSRSSTAIMPDYSDVSRYTATHL